MDARYYETLREANIVRQAEWDTGGSIDLGYAGNELAGEVSEAIEEALTQMEERDPLLSTTDLANEIADVIICIDLIALRAGLDPVYVDMDDEPIAELFDAQRWINQLGADLQLVCNTIKKLERERFGMPGSRATLDDLADGLRAVQFCVVCIADAFEINLDQAVALKFNATSLKVGLRTLMVVP